MYCDTCSCSVTSDSLQPHGRKLTKLLCPRDFPGKDTGVGCRFLLQGDLPNPGIEPACPALAGRFFTPETPGKPYVTPTHVQVDPGLGCLHSFGLDSCYVNSHPQGSITTFIPLYDSECGQNILLPESWFLRQYLGAPGLYSEWSLCLLPSIHLSIYLSISCLCSLVLSPLWMLLTF